MGPRHEPSLVRRHRQDFGILEEKRLELVGADDVARVASLQCGPASSERLLQEVVKGYARILEDVMVHEDAAPRARHADRFTGLRITARSVTSSLALTTSYEKWVS